MVVDARSLNWELDQFWDLVLLQTQTISTQNARLQGMEVQLAKLREMIVLALGRTLGNLIVIKDDVEVKEEPQTVTTLVLIDD